MGRPLHRVHEICFLFNDVIPRRAIPRVRNGPECIPLLNRSPMAQKTNFRDGNGLLRLNDFGLFIVSTDNKPIGLGKLSRPRPK